jgi:hypothetical protein
VSKKSKRGQYGGVDARRGTVVNNKLKEVAKARWCLTLVGAEGMLASVLSEMWSLRGLSRRVL